MTSFPEWVSCVNIANMVQLRDRSLFIGGRGVLGDFKGGPEIFATK